MFNSAFHKVMEGDKTENDELEPQASEVILEAQLKIWLKATLKDNLRINDSISNEFVSSSTNSFRTSIDDGDSMVLVVLVKAFPEIEDGKLVDDTDKTFDRHDIFPDVEEEAKKEKIAVKFKSKKTLKKPRKLKKSKSRSPNRSQSKSTTTSKETKPKSILKSASSAKKEGKSRFRTASPVKPKSAHPTEEDRIKSGHSKDSDEIRFFLEDELEELAPTKEEETIHHKVFDGEDISILELRLLKQQIPDNQQSVIVKTVFYLLKKTDNAKVEWPNEITIENITQTLLQFYYVGFVHNYSVLICTMESILEILGNQIPDPRQSSSLHLAFMAFHITCQPENELDSMEIDTLNEFAIFFCKNSMQLVEDFEFFYNLSNNIKIILGQNDYSRFNELMSMTNHWIDEGQKIMSRDNFNKKKDQKNVKSLLDSYIRNYLVAKSLILDFDGICNFEANNVQFSKLSTSVPRLVAYSNLLNQYLNQRKTIIQYLLPLFSLSIVDIEYSANMDYDLIEMTLQILLDFCQEFKNVDSLRNLIESVCIDLVATIGYKLQPKILFSDGSLIKNFDITKSSIIETSQKFLQWRNKLDQMLKLVRKMEGFDDNYEIWMKSLNQALQTSQHLIDFAQMLSPYFLWLSQKNDDDKVVEQKDKFCDMLEEIEKELQQITYDIFTSIGHTSWKRTSATVSAKLKAISPSSL